MIKRRIHTTVIAVALMLVGLGTVSQLTAAPVSAATAPKSCAARFLSFPPWYRGLTESPPDCNLKSPSDFKGGGKDAGIGTYIGIIALNVVEIVLQLIGYIAAFYIIYGGFIFMTQGNESSKIEKARKTITSAVIGLVLSIFSVAIVNLIFGYIIK